MATRTKKVNNGDFLLMVGTTKGAFLYNLGSRRGQLDMMGPHFEGFSVYTMALDGREGRNRLWAGVSSAFWGSTLRWSDDFGKSWENPKVPKLKFPEGTGVSLGNIWQVKPGRESEPGTLYCGVDPGSLFESKDAGNTWSLSKGLFNHPHRAKWMPGAGGMCLHTIALDPKDPKKIWVGVSAAGVYHSSDGGKSWNAMNHGLRADFMPEKYPEFGQCVHKFAQHPVDSDRFYLQNHGGVYRSDNRAKNWIDIGKGLPSDFGFSLGLHPRDPDTAFVIPLGTDLRCGPDAKLRVYQTRNAGKSWKPLTKGLPQRDAFETVLRDSLDVDGADPAGLYFGTRSGKIFGSLDEGDSWRELADGLPPITCVKVVQVRAKGKKK